MACALTGGDHSTLVTGMVSSAGAQSSFEAEMCAALNTSPLPELDLGQPVAPPQSRHYHHPHTHLHTHRRRHHDRHDGYGTETGNCKQHMPTAPPALAAGGAGRVQQQHFQAHLQLSGGGAHAAAPAVTPGQFAPQRAVGAPVPMRQPCSTGAIEHQHQHQHQHHQPRSVAADRHLWHAGQATSRPPFPPAPATASSRVDPRSAASTGVVGMARRSSAPIPASPVHVRHLRHRFGPRCFFIPPHTREYSERRLLNGLFARGTLLTSSLQDGCDLVTLGPPHTGAV